MIKIRHIEKYYNKGRRNENHVLKDLSLDFPDKGLVMLLGDSGSGKTTLLNVVGGLDKNDSGQIDIAGASLNKYRPAQWDLIRNNHIGYIFQNYYLLPQETVHDNIAMSLKMKGMTDKQDIEKRINMLLKLIGLPQYKDRKANQLSGGQQQRIAIARALSKDPNIIIADEPTGNLDRKNTLTIMNILKQISKEKLIIMVTHEETLAQHYADQIIRLKDGTISDSKADINTGKLDTTTETDIFLGDLEQIETSTGKDHAIKLYTDDSNQKPLNARLIIQNNTLYLDLGEHNFRNINLVKPDSDTKIHMKKRAEIAEEEQTLPTIDYPSIDTEQTKKKASVISARHSLNLALSKLRKTTKFGKLIYFGFAFSAAIFALAIAMFSNVFFFDDVDFLTLPPYAFEVEVDDNLDDIEALRQSGNFTTYMARRGHGGVLLNLPRFYNVGGMTNMHQQILPLALVDASDVILGDYPTEKTDMLITRTMAEDMLNNYDFRQLGITDIEAFLKLTYSRFGVEHRITGIVDIPSRTMFLDEAMLYSVLTPEGYRAYELFESIETVQGDLPADTYDILVPDPGEPFSPFSLELTENHTFNAVGTFDPEAHPYLSDQTIVFQLDGLKTYYYEYSLSSDTKILYFTENKEAADTYLENGGYTFINTYERDRDQEQAMRLRTFSGLLVFTVIAMGGSAAAYYFIIRSSMLKRIYEIGVYRAIGVRRSDVIKIFTIEILIMTTLTSLIGYSLMRYALGYIDNITGEFAQIFNLSIITFISGVILIYAINLLFGLLPLFNLLRRTPAQILTTYDL